MDFLESQKLKIANFAWWITVNLAICGAAPTWSPSQTKPHDLKQCPTLNGTVPIKNKLTRRSQHQLFPHNGNIKHQDINDSIQLLYVIISYDMAFSDVFWNMFTNGKTWHPSLMFILPTCGEPLRAPMFQESTSCLENSGWLSEVGAGFSTKIWGCDGNL